MTIGAQLLYALAGTETRMRRMIGYWSATILLYLIGLVILWAEVRFGQAIRGYAILFTALTIPAQLAFFILIRHYPRLGLAPAQLSLYQARFAILCTGLAYTALGPLRGSTLVALFVILTFTTFSLEARKSRELSILAITFLGLTMLAMPLTAPQFFDPKTELFHFTLAGSMLMVVGALSGRLSDLRSSLKQQREELIAAIAQIRLLATTDELTSLPNRRYMSELLQSEDRRRKAEVTASCMALIDIDWFKRINDVYGHDAGDAVLTQFAAVAKSQLREGDVLARWGGEEFLLYLPATALLSASATMERLRQRIQALSFHFEGRPIMVTFSAGLVELRADETVEGGLRRADELLYCAKEQGRNRIMTQTELRPAASARLVCEQAKCPIEGLGI
ncbi:MAG TPA: GGDEF domain-containing protein [Noviherbaspirillum sp.]|uniref:GGDEF domain-containing protein n=1 Tax=Noviherbaspirillum sp. TaxID=1926288 RepID=UPI002D47004B|nr:GGDEF domain-containing protein [Noviherbaspirillum sp.]HYD95969.1 GGDEF domain-containing protein [Noviherbaspirillum sp.]